MADQDESKLRELAMQYVEISNDPIQNIRRRSRDSFRIVPHQPVGALEDGDRTFGIVSQRQAGNTQNGGFLLNSSGIR